MTLERREDGANIPDQAAVHRAIDAAFQRRREDASLRAAYEARLASDQRQ